MEPTNNRSKIWVVLIIIILIIVVGVLVGRRPAPEADSLLSPEQIELNERYLESPEASPDLTADQLERNEQYGEEAAVDLDEQQRAMNDSYLESI